MNFENDEMDTDENKGLPTMPKRNKGVTITRVPVAAPIEKITAYCRHGDASRDDRLEINTCGSTVAVPNTALFDTFCGEGQHRTILYRDDVVAVVKALVEVYGIEVYDIY